MKRLLVALTFVLCSCASQKVKTENNDIFKNIDPTFFEELSDEQYTIEYNHLVKAREKRQEAQPNSEEYKKYNKEYIKAYANLAGISIKQARWEQLTTLRPFLDPKSRRNLKSIDIPD